MADNETSWGWIIFLVFIIIVWLIILGVNTYYWWILGFPPDGSTASTVVSTETALTLFWVNIVTLILSIIFIIIAVIYWYSSSDTTETINVMQAQPVSNCDTIPVARNMAREQHVGETNFVSGPAYRSVPGSVPVPIYSNGAPIANLRNI